MEAAGVSAAKLARRLVFEAVDEAVARSLSVDDNNKRQIADTPVGTGDKAKDSDLRDAVRATINL